MPRIHFILEEFYNADISEDGLSDYYLEVEWEYPVLPITGDSVRLDNVMDPSSLYYNLELHYTITEVIWLVTKELGVNPLFIIKVRQD